MFSDVRLAGELLLPEAELRRLISVKPGDVYSREKLTQSAKNISDRLGSDGYAFANVNAVPDVDRVKKEAAFTFYIDPGRRVYIRRINISGNAKTRDEVIRREMRQLEGAWYDATRIERSKVRLIRLNYFDDVNIETPAVPGSPDQVDIDVTVTEKSTGNLLAGVGYSSAEGVILSASISQNNVLGSGNSVAASVNTSKIGRTIAVTYVEPYWTPDGIARTIEIYDKNVDPTSLPIAQYSSTTYGAAVNFGIPVTETDVVNLGVRGEHTTLHLFANSPPLYIQFAQQPKGTSSHQQLRAGGGLGGAIRATTFSFRRAACCKARSAKSACRSATSNTTKRTISFSGLRRCRIAQSLMLRTDLGYGGGLNDKTLPFFKAYYGGGVGSVRGYETASLGPQDIQGNTTGGRRKIIGNAELFFPLPGTKAGDQSVRLSVFTDAGQIYDEGFQPNLESFRYSAGVGLAWNSPVGPLKFSYGVPLQPEAPGQDPALPVSGRHGFLESSGPSLKVSLGAGEKIEIRQMSEPDSRRGGAVHCLACRARICAGRRLQDRIRQRRAPVP